MAEMDIKKLSRAELLELLIAQTKETELLRAQLADAEAKLSNRRIVMENCGSIAEASLRLSGIFEAAQEAADEYLENIRIHSEAQEDIFKRHEAEAEKAAKRIISDAEKKCQLMEDETVKKCEEMTRIARRESENYWDTVSARLEGQLLQQAERHSREAEDEE